MIRKKLIAAISTALFIAVAYIAIIGLNQEYDFTKNLESNDGVGMLHGLEKRDVDSYFEINEETLNAFPGSFTDQLKQEKEKEAEGIFNSEEGDDNTDDVFNFQSQKADEDYGADYESFNKESLAKAGKNKNNRLVGLSLEMRNSMNELHRRHWAMTDITLDALDISAGIPEHDHDMFDNKNDVHPQVNELYHDLKCKDNGENLWTGGSGPMDITVLFPAEPVIFSNKEPTTLPNGRIAYNGPIDDYKKYWEWLTAWLEPIRENRNIGNTQSKLTVAQYGANENVSVRLRLKLKPGRSTWNTFDNIGKSWFQTPKVPIQSNKRGDKSLVISRPHIPKVAKRIINLMNFKGTNIQSSTTVKYTSVMLWFFSAAPDLAAFQEVATQQAYTDLRNQMVIIPVGLGVENNLWRKFMAYLNPEIQDMFPKDQYYSQYFNFATIDDLNENFSTNLNKYLCLVQHRSTCRLNGQAMYLYRFGDTTEAPMSIALTSTGTTTDFTPIDGGDAGTTTLAPETTTMDERGILEKTKKPTLSLDSCCGHDQYTSNPYDNRFAKCCDNGKIVPLEKECKN